MTSLRTSIILTLTLLLSLSGVALAGRPLAIDDADPADPGQIELEAGIAYEKDAGIKHWDLPFGVAYGLVDGLEIGGGFGGQFEERTEMLDGSGGEETLNEESVGDLVVGAKWQVTESCPLGARHALAPSVKLPTADDEDGLGSGKADVDLTWIVSRDLGDKAGAHLDLGYSWIGGPDKNMVHYGFALDYQAADSLQWVGELSAEQELTGGSDTVAQFNTGFRWNLTDSLTLDASAGSKLTDDAPDFMATLGMTWAFDTRSATGK